MTENEKKHPKITENKPLTDAQLDKVSGGDKMPDSGLPMFTRCSADPSHVYDMRLYGKCPVCGAK